MTKPRIEEYRKEFDEAMLKYLGYLNLKQSALMNRPNETTFPEFHSTAKPFQELIDSEKAKAHQAGYADGYKQGKFDAEVTAEYVEPEELQNNK